MENAPPPSPVLVLVADPEAEAAKAGVAETFAFLHCPAPDLVGPLLRSRRSSVVLLAIDLPGLEPLVGAIRAELDAAGPGGVLIGLVDQLHRSTRNRCDALHLDGCVSRPLTRRTLDAELHRIRLRAPSRAEDPER